MKLIELIGNTPLVTLSRLNPAIDRVEILGKLESRNPGGSIKDRVALAMVEAGEQSGELTHDKILLEATSGNTGIGIAMVCAAKQYRCQLIMPESASIERRIIMQAYGAEIILTPARRATDGAIEKAYAMAREHPERYFLADQFNNPANWMAHYQSTAPEIWEQTNGRVTDIVIALGTSGTAMGISRWFREHHPEVRITAVEPYPGHKIQGLKNMKESYRPGIFDKTVPHNIVHIADEDAFATVRRLAAEEGIFAGMSGGAATFIAMQVAKKLERGCVVVILADGGERYLSTPLFARGEQIAEKSSPLRLFNTMSRKKEVFKPISAEKVSLYACGPTAFISPNLAHCRRLIATDIVNRYLGYCGYPVEFYMNFTDLDDNTIDGSIAENADLREYTQKYIGEFLQAMETLHVKKATDYPLASEHVEGMIGITRQLMDKGYAYANLGSIYFDISKFKKYGRLSGVDLAKIKIGQTVDLDNYEKDNPRDFTLLKRSTLAELKKGLFFATEWGNVRPGWHIECSAMSTHYLGNTIDIHTGSQDIVFPHHENEIAIAEALTGKPLANFWLHSGQLLNDGRKMTLENNNVVLLQEALDRGYTGREIRFLLLGVHYRKPLSFSYTRLDAVRSTLKRIDEYTRKLFCLPSGFPHSEVAAFVSDLEKHFAEAMNDDLNVSGAIGALFQFIKKTNPIVQSGQLDQEQKNDVLEVLRKINEVFGFLRLEHCPLSPEIDRLIRQRERARQIKDWTAADSVREELLRKGVTVHDTASGTIWKETGK